MVVASFSSQGPRHGVADSNLADYLIEFLELYGGMNIRKQGISVVPYHLFDIGGHEGLEFLEASGRPGHLFSLCLKDPADPANNLGKAFLRARDFQATIQNLRHELGRRMDRWSASVREGTPGQTESADDVSLFEPSLAADWRTFHWDRKSLVH